MKLFFLDKVIYKMSNNHMYQSLWWLFICDMSTFLQIQVTYLVRLNLFD